VLREIIEGALTQTKREKKEDKKRMISFGRFLIIINARKLDSIELNCLILFRYNKRLIQYCKWIHVLKRFMYWSSRQSILNISFLLLENLEKDKTCRYYYCYISICIWKLFIAHFKYNHLKQYVKTLKD